MSIGCGAAYSKAKDTIMDMILVGSVEWGTAAQWAQASVTLIVVILSLRALCISRKSAQQQRQFQRELQHEQQAFESRLHDEQRAREDARVHFILRKHRDGQNHLVGITLLIAKYGSMPLTILDIGAKLGDTKQFFNHPAVHDATPHPLNAGDVWQINLPIEALRTVEAFDVVQNGVRFVIKDCFGAEYESSSFSLLP
jgi:hypothetical protein